MPNASKSPPPAGSGKPAAKPRREALPSFIRFQSTEDLDRKVRAVLDQAERAKDPARHRDAVADLVVALTGRGLDAYFLEPLEAAGAGFVTRQSAALGLAGARQVMGSVIRSIIGRMDGAQLLSVCGAIRGFQA